MQKIFPFPTQILKNIVTAEEKKELTDWILDNKDSNQFIWSGHPGTIRRTTRFSKNVEYPQSAFVVRDIIKKQIGINTDFYPDFPDGMVATYGLTDDKCSVHKDPVWFEKHITYHCVVLLSAPESGGIPLLENVEYPLEEGDGLFYAVSEVEHSTTKLVGQRPRILWIFGFSIPL